MIGMSVGRDTGFNLAAALAPALFTLAVTPGYLDVIGPDRFGVLAICWTMVAALGFASLGMGPALAYRLATSLDSSSSERSSLVWTALALAFTGSVFGSILIVSLGEFYFRRFFPSPSFLNAEILSSFPLLSALLPLSTTIGVLNGALQGMRRFGLLSAVSILNSALLALAPLTVALLITVKLSGLILAAVAANALVAIVELAICARSMPLRMPKGPNRKYIKTLLGYGAWMSGTALIAPLVMLLDRFVIGALRGPAAVTVYVLPYNLVQQLVLLPASFTTAMLPRLATLRDEEVQQLQSSSLVWIDGVLTPAAIIAIALAAPFLHLWIGPTLGKIAAPVAAILLLGGWVHGIGHVPSMVLLGRSRPDRLTKLLLSYFVPYVLILYFATLHFGVVGAAATWTMRAAFDPILFLYTRPHRSDILPLIISAGLVVCAMATALACTWTSALYWTLMVALIGIACYKNRAVIVSMLAELREGKIRTA